VGREKGQVDGKRARMHPSLADIPNFKQEWGMTLKSQGMHVCGKGNEMP